MYFSCMRASEGAFFRVIRSASFMTRRMLDTVMAHSGEGRGVGTLFCLGGCRGEWSVVGRAGRALWKRHYAGRNVEEVLGT